MYFGRAQCTFHSQDEKIVEDIIKRLENWMKDQQYKVIQSEEVEVCNFVRFSEFIYV